MTNYFHGILYNSMKLLIDHIDATVDTISRPVYYVMLLTLYSLYVLAAVHVTVIDTEYQYYLTTAIQIFVACTLLIRFHPFREKVVCSPNDQTIVLASAFFILLNDQVMKLIVHYMAPKRFL